MLTVAFLAVGCLGAYAQSSRVTLQNQEDATFYYVLDPQELQGLSAGSPLLAAKVAAFFAAAKADPALTAIAANDEGQLEKLSDGTHLLVGVFAQEGETDLPVRVISIEADSKTGDRSYALFATPAQLTVTRGVGRLASLAAVAPATQAAAAQTAPTASSDTAATPTTTTTTTNTTTTTTTTTASSGTASATASPTIAAAPAAVAATSAPASPSSAAVAASPLPAAVAASPLPAAAPATVTASPVASTAAPATAVASTPPRLGQIASFASYDPIIFTREVPGDFSVLPIADSRGWKLTGTRITGLSGVIDTMGLHLALSVPGGFSESVSYFFYVFADRAAGQTNTLTMELEPRAEGSLGACLLWQKGSPEPRLIGSVQSTPTRIELDIGSDDLNAALGGIASDTLSVDVTSGWYDRALGTWEEFYYTTISTAQIPVTH